MLSIFEINIFNNNLFNSHEAENHKQKKYIEISISRQKIENIKANIMRII